MFWEASFAAFSGDACPLTAVSFGVWPFQTACLLVYGDVLCCAGSVPAHVGDTSLIHAPLVHALAIHVFIVVSFFVASVSILSFPAFQELACPCHQTCSNVPLVYY